MNTQSSTSIVHRAAQRMAAVVLQCMSRFLTNLSIRCIREPVILGIIASAISTRKLLALLWPSAIGGNASKYVARARKEQDPVEASPVAARQAISCSSASRMANAPADVRPGFLAVVMVPIIGSSALCSGLVICRLWGTRHAEAVTLLPLALGSRDRCSNELK